MKKGVFASLILLAVASMLLSTAPVLAAPKEELDFKLYIQGSLASSQSLHDNGYLKVSPDKNWTDGEYAVRHYIDAPFNPTNVWLEIDGETIPYSRLAYTAEISGNINYLNDQQANWHLDEIVTIYTDSSKTTVLGTLEMLSRSHDYLIASLGVVVGTFVGHGTGALEGVKVQGDVLIMRIAGVSTRIREGIAVGWP